MNSVQNFVSAPEHVAQDVAEELLFRKWEKEKRDLFSKREQEIRLMEKEKEIYFNCGRFILDIVRIFHLDEVEFVVLSNVSEF
jgi:hypothetical protein